MTSKLASAVVVAVSLAFAGTAQATPAAAFPKAHAADRRCGEIPSEHTFFAVTVDRGGVPCATARNVVREFMDGGGVKHGGPYAYEQWWSLGKWRCTHGAGGGACMRGGSRWADAKDQIEMQQVASECGYPSFTTLPCKKG